MSAVFFFAFLISTFDGLMDSNRIEVVCAAAQPIASAKEELIKEASVAKPTIVSW